MSLAARNLGSQPLVAAPNLLPYRRQISRSRESHLLLGPFGRPAWSPGKFPFFIMEEPSQSTKRRLDTNLETPSLPAAKRARLSKTDLQQPAPKRPRASFLEDQVGLIDTVYEWLESVGSDREKRCRSDSYLYASDGDPISRKLTRSAPEMAYARDADGFVVPSTPHRSVAPSDAGSSRSSSRALVEDPFYRSQNLVLNNVFMRDRREQFPQHVSSLVDHIRGGRESPGPSPDEVWQDTALTDLETKGLDEPEVEDYFRDRMFFKPKPEDSLQRSDRQPMSRHAVPNTEPQFKVSNPIPDMLYGYKRDHIFPDPRTPLVSIGNEMNGTANTQELMYPFLVIEFKGNGGNLWAATNQCLGGSASCVNIAERLNGLLKEYKSSNVKQVDSTAFSIAMNGEVARLYVSWKHNDLDYYMQKVDSFLLQKPQDYIEFRKHVKNIIDWGKNKRLKEILESLDTLLEESRKRASEEAKSRPPPTKEDSASKSKKHKPPPPGKCS
ncbi:hypothetical protein ACQKWADRAFT_281581 [Trichoderma austrokoningii]